MSRAIDQAPKESYFRVTFTYGNPQVQAKYTDWGSDLAGGFISTPAMEIELPENVGTFEKQEMAIILPIDDFTGDLASTRLHAPVGVIVEEIIRDPISSASASNLIHHWGRVTRVVRNRAGRQNSVRIESLLAKQRLEIAQGLPCNHHCPFTLYGTGCGLTKGSFQTSLIITAVNGTEVTVSADPSKPDYWFHRGTIEFEGIAASIREWRSSAPTKFYTTRPVPASWVGESVDIYAGCDKTYATCRDRFSNENQFGGIGYAIPAYSPNYEDRTEGC